MEQLTGEAAQNPPAHWWEPLLDPERPGQPMIHVIRLNRPIKFFDDLPAFQIWDGGGTTTACLEQLMRDAANWDYLKKAADANANSASITRILIVPQSTLQDTLSQQWYWIQVHGPFFAATCHEKVLWVFEQDLVDAGFPLVDYDDNLLGHDGVMRSYYDDAGDITSREYYAAATDPEQVKADGDYIWSLYRFAENCGHQISAAKLPVATPA